MMTMMTCCSMQISMKYCQTKSSVIKLLVSVKDVNVIIVDLFAVVIVQKFELTNSYDYIYLSNNAH